MYNLDVLLNLKKLNISLEKYFLLKIIEDCSLSFFKENYLELLVKLKIEGLVSPELQLTKKGIDLLLSVESKNVKIPTNFDELHKKCKAELKKLTGKEQYMVQKKYSFIPNVVDFNNKLKQVVSKYKLKDSKRIEDLLLLHINKAVEAKFEYISLLNYYISKDNKSQLADDYFSDVSIEKEEKEKIEPKQIKDLF
jgi:hypothetical protein